MGETRLVWTRAGTKIECLAESLKVLWPILTSDSIKKGLSPTRYRIRERKFFTGLQIFIENGSEICLWEFLKKIWRWLSICSKTGAYRITERQIRERQLYLTLIRRLCDENHASHVSWVGKTGFHFSGLALRA